ncbi:hypothetical protein XENOCAPTIV_013599, partial [Xenoophorus captivus]
ATAATIRGDAHALPHTVLARTSLRFSAAQRLELRGVQAYSDLEGLQGLHTIPTAIVDYRGVRLSAQGLAPGFESSEQDQKDSPASRYLLPVALICSEWRLLALLAHAAKSLSIQRHVVVAPKGHQVPLFTSMDAQGLLGADGRFYLLDVFRSFPVDANFCPEEETQSQISAGEEDSSKSCEENEEKRNGNEKEGWAEDYRGTTGLPKSFPHGLCRLRPELVQAFIQHNLSAAISHFLGCLLVHHFTPSPGGEEAKKKSRRRGRGAGASESMPWSMLTGAELTLIVYLHQLRLRDYILDNQNKAPISPDDILNIFPVVKHIDMPTVDASKAYRAAQNSIQKGLLDQAHEQLKEAAYLYGRVCDDLDPEACYCNSLLAKVTFLQGKAAEARSVQLKSVVISERVLGFDHPNTIQQYVSTAYVFSCHQCLLVLIVTVLLSSSLSDL